MIKLKSSDVLTVALGLIESGEQTYACAAILDVHVTARLCSPSGTEEATSKAMKLWMTFKPKKIPEANQNTQEWWPKGDPERIKTLEKAIALALKQND